MGIEDFDFPKLLSYFVFVVAGAGGYRGQVLPLFTKFLGKLSRYSLQSCPFLAVMVPLDSVPHLMSASCFPVFSASLALEGVSTPSAGSSFIMNAMYY